MKQEDWGIGLCLAHQACLSEASFLISWTTPFTSSEIYYLEKQKCRAYSLRCITDVQSRKRECWQHCSPNKNAEPLQGHVLHTSSISSSQISKSSACDAEIDCYRLLRFNTDSKVSTSSQNSTTVPSTDTWRTPEISSCSLPLKPESLEQSTYFSQKNLYTHQDPLEGKHSFRGGSQQSILGKGYLFNVEFHPDTGNVHLISTIIVEDTVALVITVYILLEKLEKRMTICLLMCWIEVSGCCERPEIDVLSSLNKSIKKVDTVLKQILVVYLQVDVQEPKMMVYEPCHCARCPQDKEDVVSEVSWLNKQSKAAGCKHGCRNNRYRQSGSKATQQGWNEDYWSRQVTVVNATKHTYNSARDLNLPCDDGQTASLVPMNVFGYLSWRCSQVCNRQKPGFAKIFTQPGLGSLKGCIS